MAKMAWPRPRCATQLEWPAVGPKLLLAKHVHPSKTSRSRTLRWRHADLTHTQHARTRPKRRHHQMIHSTELNREKSSSNRLRLIVVVDQTGLPVDDTTIRS